MHPTRSRYAYPFVSLVVLVVATAARAADIPPAAQWRGVSDAGGEFNGQAAKLPGTYDKDYHFSGVETLKYFRARGFNMVRCPIRWERVQRLKAGDGTPELSADLDPAEVKRLLAYLDRAEQAGVGVIIDLHNYGRYAYAGADGKSVSAVVGKDAPVAGGAFAKLWARLAATLKDKPALWGYDLCNEPQYKVADEWKQLTRDAAAAIRGVDSVHYLLIEGIGWSHGEGWEQRHGKPWVDDPAGRVIYEAHDYLDSDNSGTYRRTYADESAKPGKEPLTLARKRVAAFGAWCKAYGVAGIMGEVGVPRNDPGWLAALDAYMAQADDDHLGWCYWAAGEWWGEGYPLSLQPPKAKDVAPDAWADRPQMAVLLKHLPK